VSIKHELVNDTKEVHFLLFCPSNVPLGNLWSEFDFGTRKLKRGRGQISEIFSWPE